MKLNFKWLLALIGLVCLPLLSACSGAALVAAEDPKPITIERLADAGAPTRETLTQTAADRLGLQTAAATAVTVDGASRLAIPYAAVVYDNQGNTWAYVNSGPLTFVRHQVKVDHIDGDTVILADGLEAGAVVVTTGVEELFGAEAEFQEE
jgi:hypothetical protein